VKLATTDVSAHANIANQGAPICSAAYGNTPFLSLYLLPLFSSSPLAVTIPSIRPVHIERRSPNRFICLTRS